MITELDHNLITHSPAPYLIHPLELAFSGYSGSGKTTLISKLISSLSKKYDIFYYKHNAHSFEMDRKGKDTQVAKASGASSVMINDDDHLAVIGDNEFFFNGSHSLFLNHDLAFVEGGKDLVAKKIVLLDPQNRILEEVLSGKITDVIALVASVERAEVPLSLSHLPCFHRDQVEALSEFVEDYYKSRAATQLNGLIMIGGKSSRMGKDKFSLSCQGEKQVNRLFRVLQKCCGEVFISCREDQGQHPDVKSFPQIHDRFIGMGPVGGILSAQLKFRDVAWLVVAVDMPYIDEEAIVYLMKNRNSFKTATCYTNQERGWPEPLCTIYEPKSRSQLFDYLGRGVYCPRKFLMSSRIEQLNPTQQKFLFNMNTPEDYQRVLLHT